MPFSLPRLELSVSRWSQCMGPKTLLVALENITKRALSTPESDPPAPCFFLKLPAEVRNMIYALLLESSERIDLAHKERCSGKRTWLRSIVYWLSLEDGRITNAVERRGLGSPTDIVRPCYRGRYYINAGLYPNILATCRFINAEATPILYGSNQFVFFEGLHRRQEISDTSTLAIFVATVGKSARYIRLVAIGGAPEHSEWPAWSANVKSLRRIGSNIHRIYIGKNLWRDTDAEKMVLLLGQYIRSVDRVIAETGHGERPSRVEDKLRFVGDVSDPYDFLQGGTQGAAAARYRRRVAMAMQLVSPLWRADHNGKDLEWWRSQYVRDGEYGDETDGEEDSDDEYE